MCGVENRWSELSVRQPGRGPDVRELSRDRLAHAARGFSGRAEAREHRGRDLHCSTVRVDRHHHRWGAELKRLCLAITIALSTAAVTSHTADAQSKAIDKRNYDDTFRKYTNRFFGPAFDWQYFKAQAMAESNLQPHAKSRV